VKRFASSFAAAVTVGVTALSVYASPLTEGVARADEEPAAAIAPVTPPAKAVPAAPAPKPVQVAAPAPVPRPAPVVATIPAVAAPPAPAPEPAAIAPTPAAQAISAPAAPAAATPLNLVPSKPLELAEPAPASNLGWKLGAMGLLAAAGFWAYTKKKNALPATQAAIPEMRILRRTSVGVRSELLLVDLEGQRILLGVTPSNIQSLLIVPDSAMSDPIPVEEPVSAQDSVAALRSMPSMAQLMKQLDDDESRHERTDRSERAPRNDREQPREAVRTPAERTRVTSAKRAPARKRRPEDEVEDDTAAPVEGQAEGLLAFRRGRGQ
jgi:flagellar biogenesis protein FliO